MEKAKAKIKRFFVGLGDGEWTPFEIMVLLIAVLMIFSAANG